MAYNIRAKRDARTTWDFNNPILELGELGFDTTNFQVRIGNGVNTWTTLPILTSTLLDGGRLTPAP